MRLGRWGIGFDPDDLRPGASYWPAVARLLRDSYRSLREALAS